jgi:hypothetical protein
VSSLEVPATVKCAPWARSVGLDPGGTAGTPAGFAVIDWPLPWPRDLSEIDALAEVAAVLAPHRLRLQGRVPASDRPRRVTLYRRPATEPFSRYSQDETDVGDGDVAVAVARLLDRPLAPTAGAGDGPPTRAAGGPEGSPRRGALPGEVLVCTHGRRDTCCGSAGTALYTDLTAPSPTGSTGGRPVGRTSHTGGHRFAPTVIVLPEGTAWAFADADLIGRVLRGAGPLDDVVPRYRGCTGLTSPAVQCLERAVLAEIGWPLLSSARRGRELEGHRVELSVTTPDGAMSRWEAEVEPGRTVVVPDCGRPLDEARKTETERVVRGLRQVV